MHTQKQTKMVYVCNHIVEPLPFHSVDNNTNMGGGYTYGYAYNYGNNYACGNAYGYTFDYGNGYTATVTENLTFDYCVDCTCKDKVLIYTDPDGEFITWSISRHGFSIGFNLTPIGIPLGAGININWSNGGSAGVYGEVGYRVGGTGLGSGATVSQSLDYSFRSNSWSTTTSASAYGSLGMFNAGGNVSYLHGNQGGWSWGVSAGINLIGNDQWGVGLNVGYGSDGWTYGIGGYYNPERPEVYKSPVSDNYGDQNGECVLRCLEEFSTSYGMGEYDFDYWFEQNSEKLGVHATKVKNLINNTNIFSSEQIMPTVNDVIAAIKNDKRVLAGFGTNSGGEHAVMVRKVKIWNSSGKYRIYFAETSPIRIAPYSISNISNFGTARGFWTFSPKR